MADRISSLPDPILCHILSFLETKQAISKSTLSKRWKNLWLSVPSLDLGHIRVLNINSYLRFINFVYVVFLSRDPALPINRFRLNFDDNRYQLHADIITKWINFVVQRRVQYIDLSLQRYFLETPVSILTCNTLVVLKLCSSCVGERLSPVLLPSLKTLHFENIRLPKLRDFILFLNGCPILEDLFTFDLRVNSTESLTCHEWNTFCLTNFTRADIVLVSFRCFPLKAVHNVRSLRYDFNQVHAGNDVIPTFHNLTELQCVRASLRYNWKFVVQVLTHCPNLQKLGINEAEQDRGVWWPINPNQQNWVVPDVVPQCLSLHLTTCNFLSFSGLEGGLMLAKYILKNAKVLRTMTIRTVGQPRIETLLSSCTKASATCKLTVYDVPWK